MKIYFAGSIRGGRTDQNTYTQIIELLKNYGTVLTVHVGNKALTALEEEKLTNEFIFDRDMKWLKQADVVIAEVTTPSLGVGYEIATAEKLNKKILCLIKKNDIKKLSAMIYGNKRLTVKTYTSIKEVERILKSYWTI